MVRDPRKSPWSTWLLFALYFVLSGNDSIVKAKSKDQTQNFPYALSSVLLVSCFVSLLTGIMITVYHDGLRIGLRKCFHWKSIKMVAPINALFQVAFVLKFEALRLLDPDVVSLFSQWNLLLLAAASWQFMNRHYLISQWISFVQIAILMFMYLTLRSGGIAMLPLSSGHFRGYCVVMILCFVETCATLLAEKFLKHELHHEEEKEEEEEKDFWVQKVYVDISGFLLTSIWIVLPLFDYIFPPAESELASAILAQLHSQQIWQYLGHEQGFQVFFRQT